MRAGSLSLKDLKIQDDYRSDRDNLISDFYIPCLENSKTYDRAVGFFSSTSMAVLADGLMSFVRTGGKMRLVASPQLSEEDIEAIAQGLQQRDRIVEQALVRELERDLEPLVRDRLACLAWLLAQGILEIKLAVPKNIRNRGIYHEKLGVFSDQDGNVIAFMGSANESVTALVDNFECLDVYASWIEGVKERAFRKAEHFERLWNNGTSKVEVMEFPEAAQRSLLKFKPYWQPKDDLKVVAAPRQIYQPAPDLLPTEVKGCPQIPDGLELRPYQQQAIANWFQNNHRGTLKMATGSGKTITALAHLTLARKSLEEELSGIGDAETQHLLAEKKKLEQEQDEIQTWMEEIESELAAQITVKQTLQQKLLELSEVEQLQRRRETLQAQEQELRDRLLASKKNVKRLISTRGYTVFLPSIAAKFREIVKEREQKGELPSDIKQTFVQDLLDRERCICGAELHDGTSHRKAVQAWLEKAGLAEVEAATYRVQAQVDELERQIPDFWREVDHEQAEIQQIKQKLGQIDDELDEIGGQLRQSSREDIRQLQIRLDSIEHRIEDYTLEKGQNLERNARIEQEIKQFNKQLKERKLNQGKQKLAQKRIDAAQDAVDRLKQLKVNQDVLFREQLEAEIAQLYAEISFKPYVPRLSERYELSLIEPTGDLENGVGASTGENQILSLAFIGSIIERVRQWNQAGLIMGPDSSTFPVVMDSPFGSLDSVYRRQVAKLLPGLADQMIVMVTKTQWRTEVAEEMQARIGREYVLTYNSPKSGLMLDEIERGAERYPLVRQSPNEFEYTEVIEVSRHG